MLEAECSAAAAVKGVKYSSSGGGWGDEEIPSGCSVDYQNELVFNAHPTGGPFYYFAPLCAGAPLPRG